MSSPAPPSPMEDAKGEDTFSLGQNQDQDLFKEFKEANQILMNEDDVIPILDKIERTFERIFQTDSDVAPGPLDYFLKKMLNVCCATLLNRGNFAPEMADRVCLFLRNLISLLVRYLDFLWIEHVEMLSHIFNAKSSFYLHGKNDFRATFTEGAPIFADRTSEFVTTSKYIYQLINHFADQSGFEKLFTKLNQPDCTLDAVLAVLRLLLVPKDCFVPSEFEKLVTQAYLETKDFLLRIPLASLKSVEKQKLLDTKQWLRVLLQHGVPQRAAEYFDCLALDLALRFFQCPYLEKRITGLGEIKSYIQRCMVEPLNAQSYQEVWVTSEWMVKWLRENDIMEKLYVDNVHLELLNRCKEIPQFLALQHALTREDISLIWNAGVDKHESIQHNIYHSLGYLVEELSYDLIQHLFELIRTIPYHQYETQLFGLIRRFSIKAIQLNEEAQTSQFYGLDIAWDLYQDDVNVSEELKGQSLTFLRDFLTWQCCHSERENFINKCLQNIQKHQSIIPSFRVLRDILDTFKTDKGEELERLEENQDLLQLLMDDLAYWSEEQRPLLSDGTLADETASLHELETRLRFLQYVVCSSSVELSRDQVNAFWGHVIEGLNSTKLRDCGFLWLERLSASEQSTPFPEEVFHYLFEEKFYALDCADLSPACVTLIIAFFNRINRDNEQPGSPDSDWDSPQPIVGADLLWRIALEWRDNVNVSGVITLLIDLLKRDGGDEQRGEEYISRCIQEISAVVPSSRADSMDSTDELSESATRRVLRALRILQVLTDEFSQDVRSRHGSINAGTPMTVTVNSLSTESFSITVYSNDKVSHLRKIIAKRIRRPPNSLRILAAGKEYRDPDATLGDSGLKDGQRISYVTRAPDSFTESDTTFLPAQLISQPRNFTQLFHLLSMGGSIASEAWELLMTLPTNEKILEALKRGPTDGVDWNSLFDLSCRYKLLYILQIVQGIVSAPDPPQKRAASALPSSPMIAANPRDVWCQWFLQQGGVLQLFRILSSPCWTTFAATGDQSQPAEEDLSDTTISCLSLILTLLCRLCISESAYCPQITLFSLDKMINPESLLHTLLPIMRNVNRVKREDMAVAKSRVEIIGDSFTLIVAASRQKPEITQFFVEFPNMSDWVHQLLVQSHNPHVRQTSLDGLLEVFEYGDNNRRVQFLELLLSIFDSAQGDCPTAQQYYQLVFRMMQSVHKSSPDYFQQNDKLFLRVFNRLCAHPIIEISTMYQDPVLTGLLSVLTALCSFCPDLKQEYGLRIGEEIFSRCLFDIPTAESDRTRLPPKCKHHSSRLGGYDGLLELARGLPQVRDSFIHKMLPFHQDCSVSHLWSYSPVSLLKAPSGYVGLQNLGATCYMNSLMQQLYMVPKFRYGVLSLPTPSTAMDDNTYAGNKYASLLFQLQRVFAFLQESMKKYYETRGYSETYGEDVPDFDPLVQMDADEYFNMLFDKLETAMKGTSQANLIQEIFGGKTCNQIISRECEHVSETAENFFTLSVAVKGKSLLEESLDLYVEGDLLEGDNKYQCSKCNKKVAALKRCCVEALPDNLIVHMKRFEFDLEEMRRIKVNDFCKFPLNLDLEPYTKEGLARREAAAAGRSPPPGLPQRPAEYYQFELVGILVHSGTADSGHYYSFIKERSNSRWYQFNDTHVEVFEPNEIPRQCFGGHDPATASFDNNGVPQYRSRINNAYMLFYQRRSPMNMDNDDMQIKDLREHPSRAIPSDIYQQVWKENQQFLRDVQLYQLDYFIFAHHLLSQTNEPDTAVEVFTYDEPFNSDCTAFVRIKLACTLFINTLCHAKDRSNMQQFVEMLKQFFSHHYPACKWFLEQSLEEKWISTILFSCTVEGTRKAFASLLVFVLTQLANCEDAFYSQFKPPMRSTVALLYGSEDTDGSDDDDFVPEEDSMNTDEALSPPLSDGNVDSTAPSAGHKSALDGMNGQHVIRFLGQYMRFIPSMGAHWRFFPEFYEVLHEFAIIGLLEKQFLLSCSLISELIDCFMTEEVSSNTRNPSGITPIPTKSLPQTNISSMAQVLCDLVCACRTIGWRNLLSQDKESVSESGPSETERVDRTLLDMSQDDESRVYNPNFYIRAFRAKTDNAALYTLLNHLAYKDPNFSCAIIEALANRFYEVTLVEAERYLHVFSHLLGIEDEFHSTRLSTILSILLYSQQQGRIQASVTKFLDQLAQWAKQYPPVSEILLEGVVSWVMQFLVIPRVPTTRKACERLILSLLGLSGSPLSPETPSFDEMNLDTSPTLATKGSPNLSADEGLPALVEDSPSDGTSEGSTAAAQDSTELSDKEECDQVLWDRKQTLLVHLLQHLEEVRHLLSSSEPAMHKSNEIVCGQLVNYFRLLRYLTESPDQASLVLEKFETLIELYHAINARQQKMDEDKYELLRWWLQLTELNGSFTKLLISIPQPDLQQLFSLYVYLMKGDAACQDYVSRLESTFYQVMVYGCRSSTEFLMTLATHDYFLWCVERLYLSSNFPDVQQSMHPILEMASQIPESEQLTHFRRVMIEKVISAEDIPYYCHRQGIILLNLVLKSEEDLYVFCEKQGPQKISHYPAFNQGAMPMVEDSRSLKSVKGALKILLQSSEFLLNKDEDGIKEVLNQQWETKVSFLPVLFGFAHWLNERVLELSLKLLYDLAMLDTNFFEALLQRTHQEHQVHHLRAQKHNLQKKEVLVLRKQPKLVETDNTNRHDGYYDFLARLCRAALNASFSNENTVALVLNLLIYCAMETLTSASGCNQFVAILQKVWDYDYYNTLLRGNFLLDTFVIAALHRQSLSDELFVFLRCVLTDIQDRLSAEDRTAPAHLAIKLMGVCLSDIEKPQTENEDNSGLRAGIIDFIKLAILCCGDPLAKKELLVERKNMHRLCQSIQQQPEFYEKLASGVQQLCTNYDLGDLTKPFSEEDAPSEPAVNDSDAVKSEPTSEEKPQASADASASTENPADPMEAPPQEMRNESDQDVEMKDAEAEPEQSSNPTG